MHWRGRLREVWVFLRLIARYTARRITLREGERERRWHRNLDHSGTRNVVSRNLTGYSLANVVIFGPLCPGMSK